MSENTCLNRFRVTRRGRHDALKHLCDFRDLAYPAPVRHSLSQHTIHAQTVAWQGLINQEDLQLRQSICRAARSTDPPTPRECMHASDRGFDGDCCVVVTCVMSRERV